MGVCLKTALVQGADAVLLNRFRDNPFPLSFTTCLAIDNILSIYKWIKTIPNKQCMNMAVGGCLCLDYALSYVSCALPSAKLFSLRDFPLPCPLLWLLNSYI